jgi:hypothetical protein
VADEQPTRAQKVFFWFGVLFIAVTVLAVAFFLYIASNSG